MGLVQLGCLSLLRTFRQDYLHQPVLESGNESIHVFVLKPMQCVSDRGLQELPTSLIYHCNKRIVLSLAVEKEARVNSTSEPNINW
jgi:hypothetical protein